MQSIDLSIIIPTFNYGMYIQRALYSIFFQKTKYKLEVIVIDDASTDDTEEKIKTFKSNFDKNNTIKYYKNRSNKGNAYSFYYGLKKSKGKYFCVLDSDDFWTIPDKIDRQLSFLENPDNYSYCAVGHFFVSSYPEDFVSYYWNTERTEYSYIDLIKGNYIYYHTSTLIYRNIYLENIDFFKNDSLRGDLSRQFFELLLTNKKIKILPFFGSVYCIHNNGIWNGLDYNAQTKRNIILREALLAFTRSSYDKLLLEKRIEAIKSRINTIKPKDPRLSIEQAFKKIRDMCSINAFSPNSSGFVFKNIYCSDIIDTLCSTLGYIYKTKQLTTDCLKTFKNHLDKNQIAIFVPVLNPTGGGIFKEILQIIEIFKDKKISIFVTERFDFTDFCKEYLYKFNNVEVIQVGNLNYSYSNVLSVFLKKRFAKTFLYVGHNAPYHNAIAQYDISNFIHIFSYDHGFVCGLFNANYEYILIKRPIDANLFSHSANKIKLISNFADDPDVSFDYIPLNGHSELRTCTIASRFYKCQDTIDYVIKYLAFTKNTIHFHIGEVPPQKEAYIKEKLKEKNIDQNRFVFVGTVSSFADCFEKTKIDLYISPLPVFSYKILVDMLSLGMPVIGSNGLTRMSKTDILNSSFLYYKDSNTLIRILSSLTKDKLISLSRLSTNLYHARFDKKIITAHFLADKSQSLKKCRCTDDVIFNPMMIKPMLE